VLAQVPFLKQVLATASSLLLQRVEDRFELCMAQCRTSSASVLHENMYINRVHKYCVEHVSPNELDTLSDADVGIGADLDNIR